MKLQKHILSLCLLAICAFTQLCAQVTIGSSTPPLAGALLDLKEADITTKGLGLPRVAIQTTEPAIGELAASIGGSGNWSETQHEGMLVYNTVNEGNRCLLPGVYVWTGEIWQSIVPVPDVATSLREKEFKALMALYDNLNGTLWGMQTNWGTDQPLSTWERVTTAPRASVGCKNGRIVTEMVESVIEVDLNNNKAGGNVPPEISELVNLESFIIISASIGTVSEEIGNLKKLKKLELAACGLSYMPSIGNLSNLTDLNLFANWDLTELPDGIGNLTNLTTVNLAFCSLTGTLPPNLIAAPNKVFCPQSKVGESSGYNVTAWTNWDCETDSPK